MVHLGFGETFMVYRSCLIWCLVAMACAAPAAWSQERQYTSIPFEGDPATLLRQRLIQGQRFDELLRQAHKLEGLLRKSKGGIGAIAMPKLEQPNINLEKIEDLKKVVDQVKLDDKVSPEIKKVVQDFKDGYKTALETPSNPAEQLKAAENMSAATPTEELQDGLNRWALDMLQDAEDSKVGGMIRQSPTWRNAIEDLREFITNPQKTSKTWNLGLDKLSLPEGLDAAFSKTWERIRGMEMPSLPKIELSPPELGVSKSLSKLPVPQRWAVDQSLLWVGIAVCAGLIGWQFWRRGRGRGGAAARRRLGPWPVQPDRVSSPEELIAAFEYLAALCLGVQVRTWHHRAVAAALGGDDDERCRAAGELAALYEQVRYSSEEVSLSLEAVGVARRDLCFLAGMGFP
jgi:hypothetical protein